MPPADGADLAASLCIALGASVLPAALVVALHRGLVPFARLRRAGGASEPPLWSWSEILACLLAWYASQGLLLGVAASLLTRKAVMSLCVQLGSAALAVSLAFHFLRRQLAQPWSALGLRRTPATSLLGGGTLALLLLFPLDAVHAAWNLLLVEIFGFEPRLQDLLAIYSSSLQEGDWVSVGALVLAGTVVAPVSEEILFRGFLYGPLRVRVGPLLAAVVSSAVFAFFHASLTAFAALCFLGCALCYVRERTGSLYPAMAFHAVFNGTTLLAGALMSLG